MFTLPTTLRELILAAGESPKAKSILSLICDRADAHPARYPSSTIISAEKLKGLTASEDADVHELMFTVPHQLGLDYPCIYLNFLAPKNGASYTPGSDYVSFDNGNGRIIENNVVLRDPNGLTDIEVDDHGFPIKISSMLKSRDPLMNEVWREILYLSDSMHSIIPLAAWVHFEPLPERVLNLIGSNRRTHTLLLSPAAFGGTFKNCEIHLTWEPNPVL